jgi:predicted DNA-binding transcriptional regulator YafY
MAELEPDGSRTRLTLRSDSLEWAAGALAGLGADFEVVRPDELREHLAELATRLLAGSQRVSRSRRAP